MNIKYFSNELLIWFKETVRKYQFDEAFARMEDMGVLSVFIDQLGKNAKNDDFRYNKLECLNAFKKLKGNLNKLDSQVL
jgi:hypothetical protein